MRVGFMVNDIDTEQAGYTTIRLAMALINRGHEAWFMGAGDFALDPEDKVKARARTVIGKKYKSSEVITADLQGKKRSRIERITVDDLDVLMLRNDPSTEPGFRAWAQTSGINFGRVAMRHGVIVLNDPNGLAKAMNKMYFQLFPEEVRPRTLITMDRAEIKAFIEEMGGTAVLKPLQGSGGSGVFLVKPEHKANLNQMIESLTRDGYIIAQEYLPSASEGDTRFFVMNGRPLRYKGKYAAFRRVRTGDDMRSNIHAGGKLREAVITDVHLKVAEIVRPKLVQDGMFLVGLDIVGDRLMEINVFSPGGLGSAQKFEKVNFTYAVIDALESKVNYMQYYRRNFANVEMATL
ncbi:MAG: glutathione synthase [Candidatus Eisenbacteria bacterium]|uniref:Glutathione synthetase n=1 Tax=Eiseniibacteriota bacterium TaxID=2212470 RepID=A0A948RUC8_UNCEI|nr:glutathione synthase [Candidatus Eisenbacteria bacterium]MBU1949072.1 glutathione synthase [Candidatus Eisenbacteria bacterium]MBU2691175.1 glutathione synthase [Candidatus Eisenbacteria bacterium]